MGYSSQLCQYVWAGSGCHVAMNLRLILAWLVLGAALSLPASANMLQMGTTAAGPAPPVNTGAPQLTVVPAGIALVQNATSQGGASPNSLHSTTLPNATTINNLITVEPVLFSGSTTVHITSVTTNNGTTCTQATGALAASVGQVTTAIYYCINAASTAAGGFTVTVNNDNGSDVSYPFVSVQEWSGALTTGVDAGLGNNTLTGGGTSGTLTLTPNQTNSLILSVIGPSTSNPTTITGGTFTDSTPAMRVAAYTLTDTSGTAVTHTYGFGSSQSWMNGAIAEFKHP